MTLTSLVQTLFIIALIVSGFRYIGDPLTGILLLTVAVIVCSSIFARRIWQNYSLSKLMLVYLAWLFIVALASSVPTTSMMTLSILACLPVMYLVATNTPNFAETWKILRIALFILAAGLATWAIWQVYFNVGYHGQAVGPLVDRNAFAALMNLFWFPAAYLFLHNISTSNHRGSVLLGIGLFIISTALFATSSRGGIATWLLLLPFLLWAAYKYTQSKKIVAIIPLISLLVFVSSAVFLNNNIAERSFELNQDSSTSARLLMWESTIKIALDHPVVGTGWGSFVNYYPAYRFQTENTTWGLYAHNDYLQLAAEGGILALLLQLGVLIGLLLHLKRNLKNANDAANFESAALLLGVLALFVHANVNFIFYYAFMNVLAGLYLARAAHLTDTAQTLMLPDFEQIRPTVKRLLAGVVVLLIAAPFFLHLIAISCLTGAQSGLKAINLISPNVTAYKIANFITAIRPTEDIAQEFMLLSAEDTLAKSAVSNLDESDIKRKYLIEALERFDRVRAQTANNPDIGVREVKILMAHHTTLDEDAAYTKANQVLSDNLKSNPYHADSYIMLSRLQVAKGLQTDALKTLRYAEHQVIKQLDHRLVYVEILRQLSDPEVISGLDDIEKQLRQMRTNIIPGKPYSPPANFGRNIDKRLKAIENQILHIK